MMNSVQELAPVLGVGLACAALGVPRSTVYRRQRPVRQPRSTVRQSHPRALSPTEQTSVRDVLNSERFVDQAPRTVYATLLDAGIYHCHWRTMYRLLRADAATRERRAIRRHPVYTRPELLATAPCQVWSWDITKLRGPQPGIWYSLYVVIDIFSRMIVGWLLANHEDVGTLWVAGGAGPGRRLPAGRYCPGPAHDPRGPGRTHDLQGGGRAAGRSGRAALA